MDFFFEYPDSISYDFNSQGFRDREWPNSNPEQAIWCVGDSQTLGVGCAIDRTWPRRLAQLTGINTVNVSQLAVSNDWIRRMAQQVLVNIQPRVMVVCWGFVSWCEHDWLVEANCHWQEYYSCIKDDSWPICPHITDITTLPTHILDEMKRDHPQGWRGWDDLDVLYYEYDRTTQICKGTIEQDIAALIQHVKDLQNLSGQVKIIFSANPWFAPMDLENHILDEMARISTVIDPPDLLDRARDIDHYGPLTAESFAFEIAKNI